MTERPDQPAKSGHPGAWIGYVATIAIEGALTGGLVLVDRYLPIGRYPVFYFIAVGVIAYFFGLGPSILAFILSVLAFEYFFIAPVRRFWPIATTPLGWAAWVAFLFGTSMVVVGMALIRNSQRRTRSALMKAEHELAERRRVEADRELLLSEVQSRAAQMDAIIDSVPDGLSIIDAEGRVLRMNAAAERILGSEATTLPDGEALRPEESPMHRALHGETVLDFIEIISRPDGKHWLSVNAAPIRMPDGRQTGSVATFSDITERKQAEEKLREHAELMDVAHVLVRDPESRITYWSAGDRALYGFTAEEAVGHISHELFGTVLTEPFEEYWRKLSENGHWEGELVHRAKDGHNVMVASHQVLYRDSAGDPKAILEINNDITDLKLAEEALRQLNETLEQRVRDRTAALEASNRELEAFSYSVSHDLRAPLRIIDGFSYALVEDYYDKLDEEGKEDIGWIRDSAQKMARLIDDLLRLSKVGRTEMHCDDVDLSDVTNSVMRDLRSQELDRRVEISIQPGIITKADHDMIRIALENLLGNSWKFTGKTPDARIEFGETVQDGERVYYVKDNGAGFDMDYASRLFAPFQRLHTDSEFPGTGIGLAIVRRIITRHGGRVWGEGESDNGATFYFTLNTERQE